MEYQLAKKIDDTAKRFIISAYQHGVSVILINRFLRESSYNDCNVIIIHKTLWGVDILPNNYNCSSGSLVWRRYLTNILETSEVSTFEQFEQIALQDAIDYYNIDYITFTGYWNDFTQFQNQFTMEIKMPVDIEWIMRALLYFGYTFTRLSEKLRKKQIPFTPMDLCNIYNAEAQSHNFSSEELKLRPISHASLAIRKFWKLSYRIGKDIDTILKWTEIFTGTNATENDINCTIIHAL